MASVFITDPSANNMDCPDPIKGRYTLQGFTHPPPHLITANVVGDPVTATSTFTAPAISITFKKESDDSAKDYAATVTADVDGNNKTLPTGTWQLSKPTADLVSGLTYTITATMGTDSFPRTGIKA